MKLMERYYDLTVIQDLKKIQEPIEGLIDDGVLGQIRSMSDRRTKQVKYDRKTLESGKEYGRFYAPKGCIQPIKGEIRKLVLNDHAYEVDMRNAHPTIMYQLAKRFDVELPGIENYVIRRGQILEEVQDYYKVGKDQAKELFIRLMFGGKLSTWLNEYKIEETEHHQAILDFEGDINELKKVLADKIPDWEAYKKEAEKYNDRVRKNDKNAHRRSKTRSPINSALAYTLQTIEAEIMLDVLKYLQDKKYKTIALVHDGIYVWKDKKQHPDLAEISKLVKDTHGYALTFDIKSTLPEDKDRDWLSQVKQHIPEENDDIYEQLDALQVSNEIDPAFFDKLYECLPEKKYDVRRDYRAGVEYAREVVSRARDYFKDKVYYMKQDGTEFYVEVGRNCFGDIITKNQINRAQLKHSELGLWTRHGTTNWVESIHELDMLERKKVFGYTDKPGVLNIYRRPAIMERMPEPSYVPIKVFHNFVNNICGEKPECIDYFHKYFAFVFQERTLRTQVIMIIYGILGGAGKTSVIIDLFCNRILGHDYYKAGSKGELVDTHASALYEGKRLLVLEEVTFSGDKALNAQLKDITTRSDMTVNPKYKSQYVIPDRSCLVALSNSLTPLDVGDRRVFAISPVRVMSKEESDEYHEWIKDDRNVRAVYQYYMDMDISNFSPYRDVPLTEAKKDLLNSNNRWTDFKEHFNDNVDAFEFNKMEENGKKIVYEKREDWTDASTWFRLKDFRKLFANEYCGSRTIALGFKTNAEFANVLRGEVGLEVKPKRNGWAYEYCEWSLKRKVQLCVNIEPFLNEEPMLCDDDDE